MMWQRYCPIGDHLSRTRATELGSDGTSAQEADLFTGVERRPRPQQVDTLTQWREAATGAATSPPPSKVAAQVTAAGAGGGR